MSEFSASKCLFDIPEESSPPAPGIMKLSFSCQRFVVFEKNLADIFYPTKEEKAAAIMDYLVDKYSRSAKKRRVLSKWRKRANAASIDK